MVETFFTRDMQLKVETCIPRCLAVSEITEKRGKRGDLLVCLTEVYRYEPYVPDVNFSIAAEWVNIIVRVV
jgi:hypothetical protein